MALKKISDVTKLVQGSYEYKQDGKPYAKESFEILLENQTQLTILKSNFLTVIHTGETLKVDTHYFLNQQKNPLSVVSRHSLGDKWLEKSFNYQIKIGKLDYSYTNHHGDHFNSTLDVSTPFVIVCPNIAFKALFTLTRKFEALARIPSTIVRADANFDASNAPQVEQVFIEYETTKPFNFKFGDDETISALKCKIFSSDPWAHNAQSSEVELVFSRNWGIPLDVNIAPQVHITLDRFKQFSETLETL